MGGEAFQNTFYQRVSSIGEELRIDAQSSPVKRIKKSQWKKLCKTRVRQVTDNTVKQQCLRTKLPFVRNDLWELKENIKKGSGLSIQSIIRNQTQYDRTTNELQA